MAELDLRPTGSAIKRLNDILDQQLERVNALKVSVSVD